MINICGTEFDLEQHKKTFIHYLEVVIDENGRIMYAVPSHQEKQITLACEKLNVTREELNAMCPQEYYFDFMTWLCKISGACAVWERFIKADRLTEQQIKALQMLKDSGLYLGGIPKEVYRMSEEKYTIEQIIDAITQATYDIIYAMQTQDREMLEDVLKEYLEN